MTTPAKPNEYNHAQVPEPVLLQRLDWTFEAREVLRSMKASTSDALLTGQVRIRGIGDELQCSILKS